MVVSGYRANYQLEPRLATELANVWVFFGVETCDRLTVVVEQREHREEERKSNSCATKKNITGFYTKDEPNLDL